MSEVTANPVAAVRQLEAAHRVLITGHLNPDGDALGSEALGRLARSLGTDAVIVNQDPAPANLRDLPGIDSVSVSRELPADFPAAFDLVATVECPGLDRCGFEGLQRCPILNIDHHKENDLFGALNYLDQQAPAVGEMIWRMFGTADIKPSADAATNLYVALSTDTGDFRYSNATSRAFLAAAQMVEAGARPEQVAEWVHERRNAANISLLGEALQTLQLESEGRLALCWVDREAFSRARATPADTEDIINVPRAIGGVKIVAFLKQWEPGIVRVSLRSKGEIDVCRAAAHFGGGGHTNASGCTIRGELAEVRQQLVTMLCKMLENAS